ncbi:MAG: hypothetical protein WBQ94_00905 [Terracidiphilus sp.]
MTVTHQHETSATRMTFTLMTTRSRPMNTTTMNMVLKLPKVSV